MTMKRNLILFFSLLASFYLYGLEYTFFGCTLGLTDYDDAYYELSMRFDNITTDESELEDNYVIKNVYHAGIKFNKVKLYFGFSEALQSVEFTKMYPTLDAAMAAQKRIRDKLKADGECSERGFVFEGIRTRVLFDLNVYCAIGIIRYNPGYVLVVKYDID